jgi:hypothetical protein
MTIILGNVHEDTLAENLAKSLDRLLTPGGLRGVYARTEAEKRQFQTSTIDPLLEIKSVNFGGFITIEFFNFPQWLAVNRPPWVGALRNGDPEIPVVQADIQKWRTSRDAYLGTKDPSVLFQLGKISSSSSGGSLLRELKDATAPRRGTTRTVSIFPDTDPTVPGNTGTRSDKEGRRDKRTGADAFIDYSPELWGDRAATIGPGTAPDTILFHELVHATRDLMGVASNMRVNRLFPDVEEYLAVVLADIYISETTPLAPLRGGYGDSHRFPTLANPERFLDNLLHLHPSPRELLNTFWIDQKQLFEDLAFIIGIAFNPVMQLYAETYPAGWALHIMRY